MIAKRICLLIPLLLLPWGAVLALTAEQQLARDIYRELIEINTTDSLGDTTIAAEAMAKRLKAAGFSEADVQVLAPTERKGNLVARLRGTGKKKPLLLLAHLDVVEANRGDWSVDPFKFLERDGYFYGRGTADDKAMAAIFVANLIRYKKEGLRFDRDLILALTADEELGEVPTNGVAWLLKNHRQLIDAEFALNEGGGVGLLNGKPQVNNLQSSEKVFLLYRLEATNSGGHSSIPTRDNAIYRLAQGLARLEKYDFPFKLNDTTRAYFERSAVGQAGQLGADMLAIIREPPDAAAIERLTAIPRFNAQMRTTCVATRLQGGHADNALPQLARATV
ncbi:MAG: M20/M25/M40 family metallo-hydrolase, partial [Candidatus Obscuribacterales bacterium]|nr:M20/M25/M40 family metallo-hydrolase [Steroidobacteraceae bacterium]